MNLALPAPAAQSGYAWRPLQRADAPALFQLEAACARVDGNTNPPTLLACERKLGREAASLATDTLCAADAAGQLIASAWVSFDLRLRQECRAFLDGLVHPSYRARGIGGFILNWMEARAFEVFTAIPDDRPRWMRIDWYDKGDDAIALCEQHGFRLASAGDEMRRDLDDPIPPNALPIGMTFVNWTLQNAGLFFKVYEDAFRERPGFPGWNEETWRHTLTGRTEFRADLSPLMMEGAEPTAYAVCEVEAEEAEGWIAQMGVRPAWRKRGLASALLCEIMRRFKAAGLRYALLDVNANNPQAARVYRGLGFVRTRRYTSFRKMIGPPQS